jgi:hypothetical protein
MATIPIERERSRSAPAELGLPPKLSIDRQAWQFRPRGKVFSGLPGNHWVYIFAFTVYGRHRHA